MWGSNPKSENIAKISVCESVKIDIHSIFSLQFESEALRRACGNCASDAIGTPKSKSYF